MSRELEREALDLAKWLHYHLNDVVRSNKDADTKMQFLADAMDQIMFVLGRVVADIQFLEGRSRSQLFVPHNLRRDVGIRTATGRVDE